MRKPGRFMAKLLIFYLEKKARYIVSRVLTHTGWVLMGLVVFVLRQVVG